MPPSAALSRLPFLLLETELSCMEAACDDTPSSHGVPGRAGSVQEGLPSVGPAACWHLSCSPRTEMRFSRDHETQISHH